MVYENVNPGKKLIVELSKQISLNNEPLNVLTSFSPENEIPCLTLSEENSQGLVETYIYYQKSKDEEDVYYKIRVDKYEESLGTHSWSQKSSDERDYIISELKRVINEAKLGYYNYCVNLDENNICKTTNNLCDALNPEILNTQSLEKRCPYSYVTTPSAPEYRNPQTWYQVLGISMETFTPQGVIIADELDIIPEVYHAYVVWDYTVYKRTILETGGFTGISSTEDEILI